MKIDEKQEKLKVLIVEDSELVALRLVNMLSVMEEITIAGTAMSSKEAMLVSKIMNPDVVLLDIKLPDGNGVEVLKKLKQKNQHTKVIMLTNFADPYHRAHCKEAGAEYFFDKSTEFEKIPEVLLSMYNQS